MKDCIWYLRVTHDIIGQCLQLGGVTVTGMVDQGCLTIDIESLTRLVSMIGFHLRYAKLMQCIFLLFYFAKCKKASSFSIIKKRLSLIALDIKLPLIWHVVYELVLRHSLAYEV